MLGPLRVTIDGKTVPLGGPKQRCVLAMLLLEPNRVVSTERLIDGVWGDEPNERAAATLQVYVSNLRKLIGSERIVTQRPGYRIVIETRELDLLVFQEDGKSGDRHTSTGRHQAALDAYRSALSRWEGAAIADLRSEPFAMGATVRIDEQRETVRESYFDAALALGRHHEIIAEIEGAVADQPLREHRHAQLMLALYRTGRQADALAVYANARRTLVDELGIEPGSELRSLEAAILAQDPSLDPEGAVPATTVGDNTTVRRTRSTNHATLSLPNGTTVQLTDDRSWTIGRHEGCDVVLPSPDVSRRHAEIRLTGDGWIITDLGSTNGTTVDGSMTSESPIDDGSRLSLGHVELVFRLPRPEADRS